MGAQTKVLKFKLDKAPAGRGSIIPPKKKTRFVGKWQRPTPEGFSSDLDRFLFHRTETE